MNKYEGPNQDGPKNNFQSDYEKKVTTRYHELGEEDKSDLDIWGNAIYKGRPINFYNDQRFINNHFTGRIKEMGLDKITVVDFGGAEGHVLQEITQTLESEGIKVFPIDIDREKGAIKKKKGNFAGLPANLNYVPIIENSIDAGILRFVLQYNNKEDEKKILEEAYRTLKPGGRLIIMQDGAFKKEPGNAYNEFFAQASASQGGKTIEEIKKGRLFLSGEEMESMAEKIGFKVVEARELDEVESYLSPAAYKSRFGSMSDEQYENLEKVFTEEEENNPDIFKDGRLKRPLIYLVLEK